MKRSVLAHGAPYFAFSLLRGLERNARRVRATAFQGRSCKTILLLPGFLFSLSVHSQATDAAYRAAIHTRSEKIVQTLGITDPAKYNQALEILKNQYFRLNDIHEGSKTAVMNVKQQSLPNEKTQAAIEALEQKKSAELAQQHKAFIDQLNSNLSQEQVEQIKDGMTYRVFPNTYAAYQDMLLNLTDTQKEKIYAWLKEAREIAMDAESSEKKHAVFGKYKGRINNYLSAEGYDMKKESKAWEARVKARKK